MINKQKLAAVLARSKRGVRGIPPSKAIEIQYRNTLKRLVKEFAKFALAFAQERHLIKDSVGSDFESAFDNRFGAEYQKFSELYAREFAGRNDAYHKEWFLRELKDKIGVDFKGVLADRSSNVGKVVTNRIKENSDLIVSLRDEYKQRARDAIHESFMSGDDSFNLRGTLEQIEGVTESRAILIARDQTQKACSDLNQARQKDIGVTHYFWRGIDDGRERESHIANNDQRFAWDSPPEETGHPGEDVQCRCTADPDLSTLLANVPDEED